MVGLEVPETGEFCIYGTVWFHVPSLSSFLSNEYYQLQVQTSDMELVEREMAELMQLAKEEPGVVHYCMSPDAEDSSTLHVFERYESKEAFNKHMETKWVQDFMGKNLIISATLAVCRPAQARS